MPFTSGASHYTNQTCTTCGQSWTEIYTAAQGGGTSFVKGFYRMENVPSRRRG